ncbi:DUF6134 family protein [Sneathiella limimaris]|uniref:DUF6134 family protein n=1 Tax=Sneathiella limimaris TaxID=1964213 RepID=UPI00146B6093|nr:DUF6134 family protein [Sneathiella limimaris]
MIKLEKSYKTAKRCLVLALFTVLVSPMISFAGPIVDPLTIYGQKHEFLVKRNGSVVGKHLLQFEKDESSLIAKTDFNVAVSLLGIPLYKFYYKSEGIWEEGKLKSLEVNVDEQGEKKSIRLISSENGFLVNGQTLPSSSDLLLPTNHWNPAVLQQNQVFNTILGKLNRVEIANKGQEIVEVRNGSILATRYEYSGELNLEAWYDRDGRWVKLRFLAEDDSVIEYFCLTCKASVNS